MIIIDVKKEETIDKALRRYKRKHQQTGIMKELRRRKEFKKPSVVKRMEVLSAIYRQKKFGSQ